MRRPRLLVPLFVFFLGLVLLHAARAERASAWKDRVITVDGSDEEWSGLTTPIKDARLSLGFVNDAGCLYVCVLARDPLTRDQIALRGLTVWLDPDGSGRKKRFGIRFPIPAMERGPFRRSPDPVPDRLDDQPGAGGGVEQIGGQDELEILQNGKDEGRRMRVDQAGGIAARMALRGGVLVYELKVPLVGSDEHPNAAGVEPGQAVRVEIETPEYRGPMLVPRPGGGTIGVTVGARGRGAGVYGGYPVANDARLLMKPLTVKTTVQLASGPAR